MDAFLISLGVIFIAELGDKSQLMAMTFATRFRALPVLIGVTIAICVINAVSVLAGGLVAAVLPTHIVTIVAGLVFLGFAIWTLLAAPEEQANDEAPVTRGAGSVVMAVAMTYVLAELGDKTMLATMTLAARANPVATWAGATLAMVAGAALAVVVGRQLVRWFPERIIRYVAAAGFAVFGVLFLVAAIA